MRFLKWAIIFILFNSAFLESKEGYADNDGVEIFYVDYGPIDNEPILLVQGLGGQLTFWPDELISVLQDNGFRPIVYDTGILFNGFSIVTLIV